MRTTLTIEPDVQSLLEQDVQRSGKPSRYVVNEALRRGLSHAGARPDKLLIKVHDSRLRPGYGLASFNGIADQLEDTETLRKLRSEPA